MPLCNCVDCGQLLLADYENRCKTCVEELMAETRKVKEFVRSNPGASLLEVYRETGVALHVIKELL